MTNKNHTSLAAAAFLEPTGYMDTGRGFAVPAEGLDTPALAPGFAAGFPVAAGLACTGCCCCGCSCVAGVSLAVVADDVVAGAAAVDAAAGAGAGVAAGAGASFFGGASRRSWKATHC